MIVTSRRFTKMKCGLTVAVLCTLMAVNHATCEFSYFYSKGKAVFSCEIGLKTKPNFASTIWKRMSKRWFCQTNHRKILKKIRVVFSNRRHICEFLQIFLCIIRDAKNCKHFCMLFYSCLICATTLLNYAIH